MTQTLQQSADRMQLAIRKMQLRLAGVINHCLAGHDLSIPRFQALSFLQETGPMAMNALATELGVPRPTATHLVAGLVSAGLVSREKLPEDRRVVQVALTDAGREVLEQIRVQFNQFVLAALGGLPDQTREGVVALAEQFSEMLAMAGEMQCAAR